METKSRIADASHWLWWLKTAVSALLLGWSLGLMLSAILLVAFPALSPMMPFIIPVSGVLLFVYLFLKLKTNPLKPLPLWFKITALVVVLIYSINLPFVTIRLPGLAGLIALPVLILFFYLTHVLEKRHRSQQLSS